MKKLIKKLMMRFQNSCIPFYWNKIFYKRCGWCGGQVIKYYERQLNNDKNKQVPVYHMRWQCDKCTAIYKENGIYVTHWKVC